MGTTPNTPPIGPSGFTNPEPERFEYPQMTAEELLRYGVPDWRRLYALWWVRERMKEFVADMLNR